MQVAENADSIPEEERFSPWGERLIFENVPWKEWETAGVDAVQERLNKEQSPVNRSPADLLRFLHLAISFRNSGRTGTSFTEEDIGLTVELLLKSRAWKEESKPSWTPRLRNSFRNMVFKMEGRDKRKRPVGIIRVLEAEREIWASDFSDLNKSILALVDDQMGRAYIPGIAEAGAFIIDLHAVRVLDLPSLIPSLNTLINQLTDNYCGRAGAFFILHAGWTLSAAVNTVLMFAPAETRMKVKVFSGGLNSCAEEYFDLDVLPTEFGGRAALGCLEEIREREGESHE